MIIKAKVKGQRAKGKGQKTKEKAAPFAFCLLPFDF
jgi:hypothetical protein